MFVTYSRPKQRVVTKIKNVTFFAPRPLKIGVKSLRLPTLAQEVRKLHLIQGTLVPKLTLGPFLTLSVRNGHKINDWGFRIPACIESKSRW